MFSTLPEWRPRYLFGAWIAYWIIMILMGLGPAIPLLWRLSRPGVHGTVVASAGDGALSLAITSGAAVWERSLSYGSLALLIVVPPVLLWIAWAALRPRRIA